MARTRLTPSRSKWTGWTLLQHANTFTHQVPRHGNRLPRPPLAREPSNAKISLISPTPSVEADDEGSFSMDSASSQEPEPRENEEQIRAEYEGEDVRLTSRKELAGWYSYGFAAEVFAICAMGMSFCSFLALQSTISSCTLRVSRLLLYLQSSASFVSWSGRCAKRVSRVPELALGCSHL